MSNTFYDIKLSEVNAETSDAKSLVFDIPEDLKETFAYKAGQYLTLKFNINGDEVRRSYSLSSAPVENKWRVCCKRVQNGLVSNHICDNLKTGDFVSIMAPDGRFVFQANEEREARYLLFGAGSGITPIISIAKEILEKEPLSTVYMMYGNTDENNVIYKEELAGLEKKFQGQFYIKHAYSSLAGKKGLLGGIFKKSNMDLPYYPGQISKETIKKLIKNYPEINLSKAYAYICGPGSMNEDVKEILVKEGCAKDQVHFESFGGATDGKDAVDGVSGNATIELDGNKIELDLDGSKTILDALLDKGYDPPHSCCSGACSSCMAKLVEGKVVMEVSHALDEEDIEDGYILTCQAKPTTPTIHVVYE